MRASSCSALVAAIVGVICSGPSGAQEAHIYTDSPSVSDLSIDSATKNLKLILTVSGGTIHAVFWRVETIGGVSIQTWSPRASAPGCNGGCLINLTSEIEFDLATPEARLSGEASGGGATGIISDFTPIDLGTLTVSATAPGMLRLSGWYSGQGVSAFAPTDIAVARGPCNDGVDNDSDGVTDYPEDPGCRDVLSLSELFDCSDGFDNDGDGAADYPDDEGCDGLAIGREDPACNDGLDNDGDAKIDYPDDPQCDAGSRNAEGAACGLGGEVIVPLLGLMFAGRHMRRDQR